MPCGPVSTTSSSAAGSFASGKRQPMPTTAMGSSLVAGECGYRAAVRLRPVRHVGPKARRLGNYRAVRLTGIQKVPNWAQQLRA